MNIRDIFNYMDKMDCFVAGFCLATSVWLGLVALGVRL